MIFTKNTFYTIYIMINITIYAHHSFDQNRKSNRV